MRKARINVTASRTRDELIVKMWQPESDGVGFVERVIRLSRADGQELLEKLGAELGKLTNRKYPGP